MAAKPQPDAAPRPWPSDAPPRDACRTHEDCTVVVWDGPMPPDPCCDKRVGYLPVSRAYLTFMETYRKASCSGVTCPTPPLPGAEPACCASIGRCVAKKCVSACEDPTARPPKVSVLDPACRDTGPPVPPEPCGVILGKPYVGGTDGAGHQRLVKCCASLRINAPLLRYGTPADLTEAADLCDEIAARVANECAPTQLPRLKQQLRGKGVPDCGNLL